MEIQSNSTEETKKLAAQLATKLKPKDVVALYGDLGSGKTTFTRFLVEALGIDSRVQSPTFVLLRRYGDRVSSPQDARDTSAKAIVVVNHLDLYRLASPDELFDLGLEELFSEEGAITVVEWPELAENLLPENAVKIDLEYIDETTRKIVVRD